MFKFPSIPEYPKSLHNFVKRRIIITEKLDGLNVMLHNGEVFTRDNSATPCDAEYLSMVKKWHAWKTEGNTYDYFCGEDLFAEHACQYAPIPEESTFQLFMVISNMVSSCWPDVEYESLVNDFPQVPVCWEGSVKTHEELAEKIDFLMGSPSALGGDREGLVVRVFEEFHLNFIGECMFKVVRADHVQPDAEHWRKNWKMRPIIWDKEGRSD